MRGSSSSITRMLCAPSGAATGLNARAAKKSRQPTLRRLLVLGVSCFDLVPPCLARRRRRRAHGRASGFGSPIEEIAVLISKRGRGRAPKTGNYERLLRNASGGNRGRGEACARCRNPNELL